MAEVFFLTTKLDRDWAAWWDDVLAEASRRDWRNMFHKPEKMHRRWYDAGMSPAEAALKHIRGIE